VIVCAIFSVGDVCQAVVKVRSSPELLELGLVLKVCPYLFLIPRLPVRILLFLEIHLFPDVATAEGFGLNPCNWTDEVRNTGRIKTG